MRPLARLAVAASLVVSLAACTPQQSLVHELRMGSRPKVGEVALLVPLQVMFAREHEPSSCGGEDAYLCEPIGKFRADE
jgi:hypothetical protein